MLKISQVNQWMDFGVGCTGGRLVIFKGGILTGPWTKNGANCEPLKKTAPARPGRYKGATLFSICQRCWLSRINFLVASDLV